ncbi:MAG: hypothetical protein ACW98D_16240 [Promethearchaeota archaeon]
MNDIKSRGFDLKSIISSWEKNGTLEEKKQVLDKVPKVCVDCKCQNIEYWGETEEEIVFRCRNCKKYYSIPFNQDPIRFYFSY